MCDPKPYQLNGFVSEPNVSNTTVSDPNAAFQCHSCGTPMRRTAWRCGACGRQNRHYTRGQIALGLVLAVVIVLWLRAA